MLVEMTSENPPTSVNAIRQFERNRKIKLPRQYVEFLTIHNGGVPRNSRFPIKNRLSAPIGNVQVFMGIGVNWPTTELAYAYDLYIGGLPAGVVPIANDDFGNYICFDLRDNKERVVFWDHRHFWGTGEWREADLYHVADSFAEFLRLLKPLPD